MLAHQARIGIAVLFNHMHTEHTNLYRSWLRLALIITGLIWLMGCASQTSSQKAFEKKKYQRAIIDSIMAYKASRSPTEKKMSPLLQLVKKMKNEKAGEEGNTSELSKKYSTITTFVDDKGRIKVTVVLAISKTVPDTSTVIRQILSLGGSIQSVIMPPVLYQAEIDCWIPYKSIEKIANLPLVALITWPSVTISN